MPRPHVVYLAHTLTVGGAEEMVLNLVRHLPGEFDRSVVCIDRPGPIGEEVRRTGTPLSALGLVPGLTRPADLLHLQRFLQQCAPTIVHTFLLTASLYGRFAAMQAGVPIIIGTEVNIYERKRAAHRAAERWLMRHTDTVIASAASVREFYVKQIAADPDKVVVIYNAVDWSQLDVTVPRPLFRQQLGIPVDAPVAGIIARLTEQKAHRVLLDALVARPELAAAHLLVIGDGELRGSLEQHAGSLGVAARVHFAGARRDLGNVLAAIDAFVMPSLWEGLPLSLVLAMGAGLPVIASRVAGIPEVVRHGETGWLTTPGDAGDLAAALVRVLGDARLRSQLGSNAKAFVVPRFGVDGYIASVTALYRRLLAQKRLA
jgi:glycosyltransferase involved in cell wall biosynthesis